MVFRYNPLCSSTFKIICHRIGIWWRNLNTLSLLMTPSRPSTRTVPPLTFPSIHLASPREKSSHLNKVKHRLIMDGKALSEYTLDASFTEPPSSTTCYKRDDIWWELIWNTLSTLSLYDPQTTTESGSRPHPASPFHKPTDGFEGLPHHLRPYLRCVQRSSQAPHHERSHTEWDYDLKHYDNSPQE